MATFSAIQADVATWLRDLPSDTVTAIPGLINEAIRLAQQSYNFDCMSYTETDVTVAGSHDLATIVRMKAPKAGPDGRPRLIAADGTSSFMEWAPTREGLLKRYGTSGVGEPKYLYISAVETNSVDIEVWPLSDGLSDWNDGQYRIEIPTWTYLPDLVSAGATNWFTFNALAYVRFFTLGRASLLNLEEERGMAYMQLAEAEKQMLIAAAKKMQLNQITHIVPNASVWP